MADNKYAGTQTEKNLQEAFAGESQARNKYTYFASVAQKEGYEQMSALFLKTADNEKEHAKMWLPMAIIFRPNGSGCPISARTFPHLEVAGQRPNCLTTF